MANNWYGANQNWGQGNWYDGAQEYNPNYAKSFAGIGRFDPTNMIRPSNLTQDLGASTYQAPPVYPGQRNIHEGFGTADVSSSFPPPAKTGILQNIKNFGTSILDNTMLGKVAGGFDATNKRAFNYNPQLRSQIDFMNQQKMYGTHPTSGLPQITGGVLKGQNLQSGFGSNDLGAMYEKSLARTQKTIDNFENQWGNLKEDDEDAYNAKLQVHLARKQKKIDEYNTFKAEQQKAADDRIAVEKQRAGTAPQRGGGQGDSSRGHMGGISQAQADAVGAANKAAGMSGWGLAQGGRAGYNRGRVVNPGGYAGEEDFFEDENTLEFMQDQGIPHSEMAGESPFEMRINELMDEGMSWQEAYQIASEEFGQLVEGESDQGIASIV